LLVAAVAEDRARRTRRRPDAMTNYAGGLIRLATPNGGLGQRGQAGVDQLQALGHQLSEIAGATVAAPQFSTATTRAAARADPATSAAKSMLARFGFRPRMNSASTEAKDSWTTAQMTRDPLRADQLRAGPGRGLADDFEIMREGGDAGQHRVEQRLRRRDAGASASASHSSCVS